MVNRSRVIVFAGPSAKHLDARHLAAIELRPPAVRGDLDALLDQEPSTVLLLDGIFGQRLAVSVLECVRLLHAGWEVCGASSLGALRAAEAWSEGMIGIGDVYLMLRSGRITSDDELAVAYHPDDFRELSISLVHIRAVLTVMAGRRQVSRDCCMALFARARDIYWYERRWENVVTSWRDAGLSEAQLAVAEQIVGDPHLHPKVRDARAAVGLLVATLWPNDTDQQVDQIHVEASQW